MQRISRTLPVFGLGIALGISICQPQAKPSLSRSRNFIADACQKVVGSVANISVQTTHNSLFREKTVVSSGSAFFIHSRGTLLTNAHVVSDMSRQSRLVVTLANGAEVEGCVHAMDVDADLAIVQLLDHVPHIVPVTFGTSDIRQGDIVASIGSPYGLINTVTSGVISSMRLHDEIGGGESRLQYLQTDCTVHSGSSGGPLINLDGQVVGINTKRATSEGISFAIRLDTNTEIIKQLVAGKLQRPYLGFEMATISPFLRARIPLLEKHSSVGVLVMDIEPDSPAATAGLLQGDEIVAVDGHSIFTSLDVYKHIQKIGKVTLGIQRHLPIEMDWDGRTLRHETILLELDVHPTEGPETTIRPIQGSSRPHVRI